MPWAPDNLRTKGAMATFHQKMELADPVWAKHCQMTASTSNKETYVWPGFTPRPREFLNSRQFVGMRDFTYDVTNKEYELSMIINRTHWEDDQTGLINARMAEMAGVYSEYKDYLFATLLQAANATGGEAFDGTVFHHTDHSAGTTVQTNDNDKGHDITATGQVTGTEALATIAIARAGFLAMVDDMGRPMNSQAAMKVRAIVTPLHERGYVEALNATLIDSGNTNVVGPKWLEGVDVLPHIAAATTEVYFSAVGGDRMPFIHQQRMPLEVKILNDANNVALHNGVLVLCRERFVIDLGEFRRSMLVTYS